MSYIPNNSQNILRYNDTIQWTNATPPQTTPTYNTEYPSSSWWWSCPPSRSVYSNQYPQTGTITEGNPNPLRCSNRLNTIRNPNTIIKSHCYSPTLPPACSPHRTRSCPNVLRRSNAAVLNIPMELWLEISDYIGYLRNIRIVCKKLSQIIPLHVHLSCSCALNERDWNKFVSAVKVATSLSICSSITYRQTQHLANTIKCCTKLRNICFWDEFFDDRTNGLQSILQALESVPCLTFIRWYRGHLLHEDDCLAAKLLPNVKNLKSLHMIYTGFIDERNKEIAQRRPLRENGDGSLWVPLSPTHPPRNPHIHNMLYALRESSHLSDFSLIGYDLFASDLWALRKVCARLNTLTIYATCVETPTPLADSTPLTGRVQVLKGALYAFKEDMCGSLYSSLLRDNPVQHFDMGVATCSRFRFSFLHKQPSLATLGLRQITMDLVSATGLAEALQSLPSLRVVYMEGVQINSEEGKCAVIGSLTKLTSLQELIMDSISDEHLSQLITRNRSLRILRCHLQCFMQPKEKVESLIDLLKSSSLSVESTKGLVIQLLRRL